MTAVHAYEASPIGICRRCSFPERSMMHVLSNPVEDDPVFVKFGQIMAEGIALAVEGVVDYVTPVATYSPTLGREMLVRIIAKLNTMLEE